MFELFFFSFLWKTVLFVALSFAMFNFLLMSATHNFYKTQRAKKQHKTDRGDNKSDMHRQSVLRAASEKTFSTRIIYI